MKYFINKLKYLLPQIFITIIILLLLTLLVKGRKESNILFQNQFNRNTAVGSPFESSGSTSRYALTESIVENNTFVFNIQRAMFSSPDVTKVNGKYFSVFTPGVAFVGVPFYLIGRLFGIPQLFTYFSSLLFSVGSFVLVTSIAKKIGAGIYTSIISGLMFLFGTNALAYSLTFTQHSASTFIILMGIYLVIGKNTFLKNVLFGVVYGVGLLMDIPNGIIMLPLVLYILAKQIEIYNFEKEIKLKIKLNFIGMLIGLIPLIALFGWYNIKTTGSYTELAQFVGRSKDFSTNVEVINNEEAGKKALELPFNTRSQIEGLNILLFSDQRSIFVYSPIIILGLLGFVLVLRKNENEKIIILLSLVAILTLLLYSMFGDPTGSWAFGPRYMIPSLAILCTGIGISIERFKMKKWFILLFLILVVYSIGVNVMGAMTTILVPPKVEAINMADPIPYTYEYNYQLMTDKNLNSSLFYDIYLSDKLTSKEYALLYFGAVFTFTIILYTLAVTDKKKTEYENI